MWNSSQEARRDFIRTIHHTVREHAQRTASVDTQVYAAAAANTTVSSSGGGVAAQSQSAAATTSSTVDVVTSTSMTTTFGVTRRPESLSTHPAGQPRDPRHACRPNSSTGDRYSLDVDERRQHSAPEAPRSRCLTLSDLNRSNLAEHGALTHQQLGSQSTLASDRGAGGARLLHTSHDPLHYSTTQSAASAALGGHHHHRGTAGDAPGSPIWKRRRGGAGVTTQSPASNDECAGSSHSDADHLMSSSSASGGGAKQRVTFRIPPSAYIETEDTDC